MADLVVVEETLKRLSTHKGVEGVLVADGDGVPIRSTMDHEQAVKYAALTARITRQARSLVREAAADDELQYLRLRTKNREIMIASNYDREQNLSLVVVQKPNCE
jgi:dynein light chain roadblock-type